MSKPYDDEFKKRIVRLRFEDGRTIKSICEEYGVSRTAVKTWCKASSEECQSTPENKVEYDYMLKNRQLRKQLEELEKENRFLKKAAAFFAKEID
jgi:transposase